MTWRNQTRVRAGMVALLALLAAALFAVALLSGSPVRADEHRGSIEDVDYASPLEVMLSPDGARLYVLCQQSGCGHLRSHQEHHCRPRAPWVFALA